RRRCSSGHRRGAGGQEMSALRCSMKGAVALLIACAAAAPAAELPLAREGWSSWQVPAVDGAPGWCCTRKPCRVAGSSEGYSVRDDETTDAVNVYARTSGGKVDSLQVFAASCPVEAKTQIQALDVAPDDSARWLIDRAKQDGSDSVARRPLAES